MQFKKSYFVKLLGLGVVLLGGSLLYFVLALSIPRYAQLFSSQGTTIMAFLFSLGFLIFFSGLSLIRTGSLNTRTELVPRWALAISGGLMVLSVIALTIFQSSQSRSSIGLFFFGVLGLYWLRQAFTRSRLTTQSRGPP